MDARQTLNIVDKYFNTFEILGVVNDNDFITLLYLMFIDEYYEMNRDISFKDINNDEIGLTDCLVQKLNRKIECLKKTSNILKGIDLDYLPTKYHWIIPDDHSENESYVENHILYTEDYIDNRIIYSDDFVRLRYIVRGVDVR